MTSVRSGRLLAGGFALLALVAAGCTKAPILTVDGLKVGDMGITGVALDVRFRVRNPNPEPIVVERMEYELFVNGRRLGRGFESKGLSLEGFGEGKVDSRVDVNFLALPGAVKEVLRRDRVEARVKGSFYISGSRRLGFDADTEVSLGGR